MAVMNVRQLYPDAQDARVSSGDMRFRDTLRAILWANYSYMDQDDPSDEGLCARMFEDAWEKMWKPRFIPDLWSIDSENKIIGRPKGVRPKHINILPKQPIPHLYSAFQG